MNIKFKWRKFVRGGEMITSILKQDWHELGTTEMVARYDLVLLWGQLNNTLLFYKLRFYSIYRQSPVKSPDIKTLKQ